jgi:hypothetical protein
MVPEEWPIAAPPEERGAGPARPAGRERLATVRRDFFLDPRDRLTEQERALMTAMLADLLGGIADEIGAALPRGWGAANDEDGQQLVRQLGAARLLDQPQLIALLLRRADEERIATAVRARSPARPAFLQALIADSNEAVAASAMALILARGRRRDRLGQPRIDFDDLQPALADALAHSVAAALRKRVPPGIDQDEADRQLSAGAAALIERQETEKAVGSLIAALARVLIESGALDDDLLEAAAEEGDLAFVAGALAQKAEIADEAAWDHLLDGEHGGFVMLLRMAGVSRSLAARLLAALADLVGITDPGAEIARFDSMDEVEARREAHWLRLNGSYRAALDALGGGRRG